MGSLPELSSVIQDEGTKARLDPAALTVVEERARVDIRQVEGDRVRVSTHTHLVEEHLRESLVSDNVEVTRVPVNRTLEQGEEVPGVRTEGLVTIIPVVEEIVVVEKRLLFKEEVHVLLNRTSQEVDIPVTLRKQVARVERTGPDSSSDAEPV